MNVISTLFPRTRGYIMVFLCLLAYQPYKLHAQFCVNNSIFGLTQSGYVYPINQTTGSVSSALNTYSGGNAPSASNALGYNPLNGSFYFFKRNPGGSSQEFVRLSPGSTVPVTLAACPTTSSVVRGCASFDGAGYYCIDNKGYLYYYNITYNTWVRITTKFLSTSGVNLTTVFTIMTSGDMAIDGNNRLWIVISSSSNFGLYKVSGVLPTTAVSNLTLQEILPITTATPGGGSFAGICFNSTGQVLLGSINEDKLYKLENNLRLTFVASFSMADIGNDLTSCAFPMGVLGDEWKSFKAIATSSHKAILKWEMSQPALSKQFTIQVSTNGTSWKEAGTIVNTADSQKGIYQYQTTDTYTGTVSFRILQVDQTGKETYSEIKLVDFKNSNIPIKIWPVPAQNFLFLESSNLQSINGKMLIFDQFGQKQMEWVLRSGVNKIPISNLENGSYIVDVVWDGEQPNRQIILKQ